MVFFAIDFGTIPQVALQTVLDFIAEQQRYCQQRENLDRQRQKATPDDASAAAAAAAATNGVDFSVDKTASSSSLLQLRRLIGADSDDDDDDDGDDVDATDSDDDAEAEGKASDQRIGRHGFSTAWMPVRSKPEHIDLNNLEVRPSKTQQNSVKPSKTQ